jgi:hypothetical protein
MRSTRAGDSVFRHSMYPEFGRLEIRSYLISIRLMHYSQIKNGAFLYIFWSAENHAMCEPREC